MSDQAQADCFERVDPRSDFQIDVSNCKYDVDTAHPQTRRYPQELTNDLLKRYFNWFVAYGWR